MESFLTKSAFFHSSEFYPTNRRVLLQAVNSGVFINLFEDDPENPSVFLQFPAYVPIANGQWHHVAVIWSAETGEYFLPLLAPSI